MYEARFGKLVRIIVPTWDSQAGLRGGQAHPPSRPPTRPPTQTGHRQTPLSPPDVERWVLVRLGVGGLG